MFIFLSFFSFPPPLSLSFHFLFPLLAVFFPTVPLPSTQKTPEPRRNEPFSSYFIHGSSSMTAPYFFWAPDCAIPFVLHQEVLLFSIAQLHNKTCYSPLMLLHALLSIPFDVLRLWMRIGAVKFMDLSSQLEVTRRGPYDRQKWN